MHKFLLIFSSESLLKYGIKYFNIDSQRSHKSLISWLNYAVIEKARKKITDQKCILTRKKISNDVDLKTLSTLEYELIFKI